MNLRILFMLIGLVFWSFAFGQTDFLRGEITDTRDGKTYETVQIADVTWLLDNMKYKTENAVILEGSENGISIEGYYYSHEEADNVCPSGFRLPKQKEWTDYLDLLLELKDIPEDSIVFIESYKKNHGGWGMEYPHKELTFFEEPNPLQLKVSGIIQGNKFLNDGAMSFWTRKEGTEEIKYHIHIESNSFYNHYHKHHIISRKKKRRKFLVRCVKE